MSRERTGFLYLNVGHLYDHMFMLLYPTVVLVLGPVFNEPYSVLLALATPGFIAFGAFALPAGWLADRWSRPAMMVTFFVGIGAASILTGLAETKFQLAGGLFLIGVFGAIYHPVGIALVVQGKEQVGRVLGINGVYGNVGVAAGPLMAGAMIDLYGWRAAFFVPGVIAMLTGLAYAHFQRAGRSVVAAAPKPKGAGPALDRRAVVRVLVIVAISTVLASMIYQVTTIALPKIFHERLSGIIGSTAHLGLMVALVVTIAAFSQILVGVLIDRYSIRTIFGIIAALQAPIYILIMSLHGYPMFFLSIFMMLLVFGEIPINDALIARVTTEEYRSRIYAIKFMLALGVSAMAVPFISLMHEYASISGLIASLAGFAVSLAVLVLFLPRTGAVLARRTPAPATSAPAE